MDYGLAYRAASPLALAGDLMACFKLLMACHGDKDTVTRSAGLEHVQPWLKGRNPPVIHKPL